jgi:predicted transcriptional regulator of viral defense system
MEEWQSRQQERNEIAKVAVARVADRQFGRVSVSQLQTLGIGRAVTHRWAHSGYLHWILPRVYAVGHRAPSVEADLAAALLYAGPGAMLSHATAAWWWQLTDERPRLIHVSTPRRCKSIRGIRVHTRREHRRVRHRGLPITTVPQTLLDYAATATLRRIRRALAEADYRRLVTPDHVDAMLGRGRPGSARLRRALEIHQPRLAETRSPLEVLFLELCERHELPLPSVNVLVQGFLVDALWQEQRLVVELDGAQAHATPAMITKDRARDLALRRAGYTVIRYSYRQVAEERDVVAADVRTALG